MTAKTVKTVTGKTAKTKDPWQPLSGAIGTVVGVLIGFPVLIIALDLIFRGRVGTDWWALVGVAGQNGSVCTNLPDLSFVLSSSSVQVQGLHDGAAQVHTTTLCTTGHAGGGQQLAGVLAQLPSHLLFLGAMALLYRLLRGEARRGVFSVETVGRLRFLGWFLTVGSLVASTIQATAQFELVDSMMDYGSGFGGWLKFWHPSPLVILVGLGLLAFARVMGIGAVMREDIEATI